MTRTGLPVLAVLGITAQHVAHYINKERIR
jgi:hypothetical protein